jgi:uncharacterized repeat protein (TIGR01451 family)
MINLQRLRRRLVLLTIVIASNSAYGQPNETQLENANPGTTAWQLTNPAANREIEGYSTLTSVNRGGIIGFLVNTAEANYTLEIYRTGWYGGTGGRLMVSAITLAGINQPMPTPDPSTKLVECNWSNPYVLMIPNTWVSGVYLVKLTGLTSGKQSYIVFVVRENSRSSAILFQTAVTTYQAYNNWPGPNSNGHSLYTFNSANGVAAYKVSFNRPYYQDPDLTYIADVGSMYYLRWEYNMVRWMEMSGYDVTYCTNLDLQEIPNLLLSHKAFLSVGHDEYWSWQMRSAVIAARDAGVGIGFFAADVCYWQVRLEASTINGAADRNVVAYKEHANLDPVGSTSCYLTTLWRQNPCVPSEQSFIGVEYLEDGVNADMVIVNPSHWSLVGTGLSNGSRLPGLVGYEADGNGDNNSPAGTAVIAQSPIPNGLNSQMVSYTASSGATVFATGTIQWSWGLDDWGVPSQRTSRLSPAAQQITRNVLARLTSGTVQQPQPPVSDDFNSTTLNTSLWTFGNPAGGSYSLNGTHLLLSVPGGSTHDPADTAMDNAVRVMQSISNIDFDVIVKFDSIPNAAYSNEGIIVEQDGSSFVRFDLYSDGSRNWLYAASVVAGNSTSYLNTQIAAGAGSFWLEVKRAGNSWTESWSTNGTNYTTAVTFTYTVTTARIGPFASNWYSPASAAPAFTASIDYFHNAGSITSAPNLTIGKSHSGSLTQGSTGSYTIAVSNVGNAPTGGTVTVTDTIPAGLTATSLSGSGWACALTPSVNCTRSDALAAGGSYPAITLSVSVAANAPASVTNTATVAGGGASNATATDPTSITGTSSGGPVSDDFNSTTLNTSLWTFVNPAGGSYSLNGTHLLLSVPGGSTHDPADTIDKAVRVMQSIGNIDFDVIVKFDSIPNAAYSNEGIIVEQDGSSFVRFDLYSDGSRNWLYAASVVAGNSTSYLNTQIAAGAGSFWLEVKRAGNNWTESWSTNGTNYTTAVTFTYALTAARIGPFASNWYSPASATPAFTASVKYFHNANSTTPAPNLTITKSHSGNFTQGSTGAYTIAVANVGNATTSGAVTMTDTIPAGFTATSLSGSGWTCALTPSVNCTRSDALAAGGSYPAITLSVSVAANAPASVTNTATVAGGGASNATATDPTTINGGSSGGPVADDFNSTTLNTSLWTFVNPAGGSYSLNGTELLLSVPGGSLHDPTATGTNNAIRMMQSIGNVDFDVIVKFDSIPNAAYSNEGIIVEQDSSNFVRFEVYSDGNFTNLYAATIIGGNQVAYANGSIALGTGSFWLEVKRTGSTWTESWSTNGVNYTTGVTFTQPLTATRIGPLAANSYNPSSATPAFTAAIDYFHTQ